MTKIKQNIKLFILILAIIQLSNGLDPGIFKYNKEEKINRYNEENKKSSILHTLHDLGESYMNIVQFFSDNVINKIQNFLSLDYYLMKRQLDYQYGYEINLDNHLESNNNIEDQFQSNQLHKSMNFRILTDQYLHQERMKNQQLGRTFSNKKQMEQNPVISTIETTTQNDETENILISNKRILQDAKLPDDGEMIKFGPKDKCRNNAFVVVIEQTAYFCNYVYTQEKDYKGMSEDQQKKNNCETRKLKFEACLCPVDYVGRRCEFETRIYCSMSLTNKQACPQMNSFEYVSTYSGLPPCLTINSKDFLQYSVKAECSNLIDIIPKPKVYGGNSDMEIKYDEIPPSQPNQGKFDKFTYAIDTPTLKISRLRHLFPQVQYINWNNLGENVKDSYQQKYSLTPDQLTGLKTFDIALNFRKLNPNITTIGRYTVEFNLFEEFKFDDKDPFVMATSDIVLLVFEDDSYVEPKSDSINVTLIILVVVLSVLILLVASFLVFYYYRQKKLKERKRNGRSESDEQSLNENLARDSSPQREPMIDAEQDQILEDANNIQ